jgi:cytochrome c553
MRRTSRPLSPILHAAIAAIAALAAFSTNAQVAPAAAAPAKLGLCAACHGERGVASARTIPNLAGQNLEYLRIALAQYQSGARDVAAMRAATAMLNATELDQVLQWYAAQAGAGKSP